MKLQPRLVVKTRSADKREHETQACAGQQLLWLGHSFQVRVFTTNKVLLTCTAETLKGPCFNTLQAVESKLEQQGSSPSCLPWLMHREAPVDSGHVSSAQFSVADGHGILQQSCHIRQQPDEPGPGSTAWLPEQG
jgi:hypothetical protein